MACARSSAIAYRSAYLFSVALLGGSLLTACAQTQTPRYGMHPACAPQGCHAPAYAPPAARYTPPRAHACCTPPPVVYVDRIQTVTVEKPVEKNVEVEKIVEVDKIVEVEKPVYIEVPAPTPEPPVTVCCQYLPKRK